MSRWLILNSALCKNNRPGELDLRAMKRDLAGSFHGHNNEARASLLEWANDLQNTRASFLTFLIGTCTLSPAEYVYSSLSLRKLLVKKLESEQATDRLLKSLPIDQHRQLWDELLAARAKQQPNNLGLLSGSSGALETIGSYVGVVRGREARIIRQLTEILPELNKELD